MLYIDKAQLICILTYCWHKFNIPVKDPFQAYFTLCYYNIIFNINKQFLTFVTFNLTLICIHQYSYLLHVVAYFALQDNNGNPSLIHCSFFLRGYSLTKYICSYSNRLLTSYSNIFPHWNAILLPGMLNDTSKNPTHWNRGRFHPCLSNEEQRLLAKLLLKCHSRYFCPHCTQFMHFL